MRLTTDINFHATPSTSISGAHVDPIVLNSTSLRVGRTVCHAEAHSLYNDLSMQGELSVDGARSQTNIKGIAFGTGYSIYAGTILPAIENATDSVILVTCFWAASRTRDALNESLLKLSNNALLKGKKVRVRIGFSSSSLFQKLFHTASPEGKIYDPLTRHSKLGLPRQNELANLDLEIKSIFFLPFSVWHPKFVIVDGKEVFLPSCNVSWEDWFEGCVNMTGSIVEHFVSFWDSHWANATERHPALISGLSIPQGSSHAHLENIVCKFLPSPHHRNPDFRLPWQTCTPPPETPLNLELLAMFAAANKEIYLQTPNLTCAPVLNALVGALERGVAVDIVTSERLMILEQLVTAGTTTSRCIKKLISQHQQMLRKPQDEEIGISKSGRLRVSYYEPRATAKSEAGEPVQSHLKLTIVDDSILVLGSGNMDRASWYTSQELGVAFYSTKLPVEISRLLAIELQGRTKLVYDSEKTRSVEQTPA